ncbi:hypothetical protein CcaverHIS631_0703210 [Cutaneotrichosporon cavernicola]|nr:hypothetical protein CcaverHIS631_0703210 [Cutaneotrichosporon cavernicola]
MPQPHQQNEEKRRQTEIQKQRRHVCPVCDKRFNRPSSLNTHMSVHTGAKPYQCLREGCGRRFSVSSNLRRHERTHDARARPQSATPARPAQASSFSAGYYSSGNNYYMQPQFDYAVPSSDLRDYAVVGPGVASTSANGSSSAMSIGVAPPQRRESAPSYYQTTPAPSSTPAQMFHAHKSMPT